MHFVSVKKLRWQINFNAFSKLRMTVSINPLNAELNPTCHLLALLGAHHILHISRLRVKQQLDEIRTVKSWWGKGCKGGRKARFP